MTFFKVRSIPPFSFFSIIRETVKESGEVNVERDERETVRATILFEIVASGFIKPFLPFPLFLLFEN